jgi:nucleoside phosphorylase
VTKSAKGKLQDTSPLLAELILGVRHARHWALVLWAIALCTFAGLYAVAIGPIFEPNDVTNIAVIEILSEPEYREHHASIFKGITAYNAFLQQLPAHRNDPRFQDALNSLLERVHPSQYAIYPYRMVLKVVYQYSLIDAKSRLPVSVQEVKDAPRELGYKASYSIRLSYFSLVIFLVVMTASILVFYGLCRIPVSPQRKRFEDEQLNRYFFGKDAIDGGPGAKCSNVILICTAIDVETAEVIEYLHNVTQVMLDGAHFSKGYVQTSSGKAWEVYVRQLGKGNAIATGEAQKAFSSVPLARCSIFVGVAGGIKDVNLGDLVVCQQIFNYEQGKYVANMPFLSRPVAERSDRLLVELAKLVRSTSEWKVILRDDTRGKDFKVYVDTTITGEKVIADLKNPSAKIIKLNFSGALALDMEGAGFLYAAHGANVRAIVIRGISDQLTNKDLADSQDFQRLAAARAAGFAFALLSRIEKATVPVRA